MNKENLKNGILEGASATCSGTAKVLRAAADKCEQAAKYCESKKTGKFTFGFKFTLGDHEFNLGNA